MPELENITYDELHANDYATFTKSLTEEALLMFAVTSRDIKSKDFSVEFARQKLYTSEIGYGLWVSGLISTAFSRVIPGPGSIHLEQDLNFKRSVELHDTLTVKLTVLKKLEHNRVLFFCEVFNQSAELIVNGEAKVIAPTEKISLNQPSLPSVIIKR